MKVRNIVNGNVVWFGSQGLDENGNKIPADSFVYQQDAIVSDLTQKLSILKSELWYKVNYGLPIFEKVKSKSVIDANLLSIISSHPKVISISKFESQVINREYKCKVTIVSEYGQILLQV